MAIPHDHVALRNGRTRPDGGPSLEMVAATHLSETRFRLIDSPWTLYGCASGDVVEMGPEEGEWTVVQRGGRVSVQCFVKDRDIGAARALEPTMTSAGGTLDNMSQSGAAFVFSFAETIGHRALCDVMAEAKRRYPDLEWGYGNVYSASSDQPLEWAIEFLAR